MSEPKRHCWDCLHRAGPPHTKADNTCKNAGLPDMYGKEVLPDETPDQALVRYGLDEYLEEMQKLGVTCWQSRTLPTPERTINDIQFYALIRREPRTPQRYLNLAASGSLPDREISPSGEIETEEDIFDGKIWG